MKERVFLFHNREGFDNICFLKTFASKESDYLFYFYNVDPIYYTHENEIEPTDSVEPPFFRMF
ncbi:hypothetical protein M2459_000427 [Parabacteroides sp. PF5-5]|nr:hypothetical protein [Parabacteroides sp. PH5-39]MDH6314961.1 hypothetical protein [Parabacteroides sp. PF5-13]MDH6318298.1 hypothetical protein [Parabacteroides sp. PH5-13]MDH6321769.1 hypothetical protein [Parabacteroides sp. PH5-8]MDH6325893.1 hypothetical protein [Parabacteroides sp. PH5-41]MDH6333693.1 hypothetical protein [Parabacteroides sp. PF5-5]MDH6344758.1 hypothetical protein [Parabacteroides sp. PH5-46]MDH6359972.1 hypothetical protein [Parabacteroides sp. PH5-16]MDH6375639.